MFQIRVLLVSVLLVPYGWGQSTASWPSGAVNPPAWETGRVAIFTNGDLPAPPFPAQPHPDGETVSAARLRHKPPRKALSAFARGLKFDAAGSHAKARAEFQRAVDLDPGFSEAHGNLGVELTGLGLLENAADEFRKALAVDPATSTHHANLALVLIEMNRDKEAEQEAQTAVDLDANNIPAQFFLGLLLAADPETRAHAEPHLVFAARTIPAAHLALAQLYTADGATERAASEMASYRKASAMAP